MISEQSVDDVTEKQKPISDEHIASYSFLLSKEGLDSERIAKQHAWMRRQYKTEYDIIENDGSDSAKRSNEQGGGYVDPMPHLRILCSK